MTPTLAESYSHCPMCGSSEYVRSGQQRHCERCGHRDFSNPIVAVAALLLDAENRLLLIRRAKDPAKGKLAMPGGFVDAGEPLEQAIHREIEEEIGLTLSDLRYLSSHPNNYIYQGFSRPVCDVFFTARADSFDVVMQQDEVAGWVMIPLAEINPEDLAFDSMRHALQTQMEYISHTRPLK